MIDQIVSLAVDDQEGLFAIIVSDDSEVKRLHKILGSYSDKFQDLTEETSLKKGKWNILLVEDSKGLEFNTVIVFDGMMSRNQKYISYTRALDELYVCSEVLVKKRQNKDEEDLNETIESEDNKVDITIDANESSSDNVMVDISLTDNHVTNKIPDNYRQKEKRDTRKKKKKRIPIIIFNKKK